MTTLTAIQDKMFEITGFRIKFQEAGGLQLKNCFSTELSKGQHCGRVNCPPCNTTSEEKRQNCRTQNILYETKCLLCNPPVSNPQEEKSIMKKGRKGIYFGETSRSFQERMAEHVREAEKFHPKSHIIKHWMTEHREVQQRPPFAFSIVQKYKDCLSRQIGEAIKIYHTTDNILNSKCEYLSNCISRLTVLEDDWEKKQRERNEEEEEYREKALLEEFKVEKMTENGIMLEEDTNQDEIEENQTEEKLLEEDPEMFRKSRKEKQRDSIHEEHKECMIKKRRVNTSVSDPLSEGVEQIEKSSLEEKMQSHGGPGHHHGGGAPHQQINTRACGNSSLPSHYHDKRNKMKKSVLKDGKKEKRKLSGPNLTWWTSWWNRVEKEAEKDRKLARTTTKITAFTQTTSREVKMFPNRVFLTGGRGDVIKERHSEKNFKKIDTPKSKPTYCEAKPVSGTKRALEWGMESPAKRSRSFAFKNLLEYWDGAKLSNEDFTFKKSHTHFKNATQPADTNTNEVDLDLDLVDSNLLTYEN